MAVDNYFVERRNQFHSSVYQKVWRGAPTANLVKKSAFDLSEGRTPTVRTLTHELPTAYPTALTEITVSSNSGNPFCNPSPTTIKRGENQRTFNLTGTAFRTDTLCLSDLKRAEDAAGAIAGFERGLSEYLRVFWGDWYRIQNISQVDYKASTLASGAIEVVNSTAANHTGLATLPTTDLSWDHLKQIYWQLVRSGLADELAVGRDSKGRPVLPLMAGPGIIAALWKDDTHVKEQVKYFDSAKNLEVLGYDGAINGFVPVLDVFPIRYGKGTAADQSDNITSVAHLTAANMIYPTVNGAATVGRKYSHNPAYDIAVNGTAAKRAKYEVVTILARDVYEAKFETMDPSQFAGANFKPTNYVGEFQWINNRTFEGENDLGNQGYYRADVRIGAKPIYPEFGYSILTLARNI